MLSFSFNHLLILFFGILLNFIVVNYGVNFPCFQQKLGYVLFFFGGKQVSVREWNANPVSFIKPFAQVNQFTSLATEGEIGGQFFSRSAFKFKI